MTAPQTAARPDPSGAGSTPDRTGCPGTRHGDRTAYKAYGCRCLDARADKRRHEKARAIGLRPPAYLPALGTVRRLQALAAIGWDAYTLAARLHINACYLKKIRGGATTSTVTPRHARQVTALYDRLCGTPGPSLATRVYAARVHWAPPLAWDDGLIDDPAARPDLGLGRAELAAHRAQRVADLAAAGKPTHVIAEAVGMTPHSVRRLLRRAS